MAPRSPFTRALAVATAEASLWFGPPDLSLALDPVPQRKQFPGNPSLPPAQPIQKTASEGKASRPLHILQYVPDCNANHLSVSLIVGKIRSTAFIHSSQSAASMP